ncbi:ATPase, histidine kinase-, DNA gyrase B-, and HSP90-like domain protein [Synechococcus sp. PCC 7335]|uniref:molecular chaperone HtpG n=1 Tax=Synechococcus sp. (strain ATCC 29403 / PCC 7335) TaxID=91464 RepID=UPI00017ECE28|nr:molecular chaperone HtpG [Synechococcus sp. PCC 7335]EDX87859.1 ATPase, histidine kinase-, DNA gyrase B-, and HSP90-like domain protein [Synechococcus sp. PCC 7335]
MTTVLEQGNISIHTENIFPIIKKWLYSDHEIFLRELVSNGVDAISKLNMLSRSGDYKGETTSEITIAVDKEAKTLSISDSGIGMTGDEIKKYINQVAFSSAEEFISKYKDESDQQIIGHFGLGFYSSFMVADRVDIDTLSWQDDAQPVHWSCDGSTSFELSQSDRTTRGTTITLYLNDDEQEYLEDARIKQLVKTYCDFLPVPISFNGEVINKQEAPWKKSPSDLTDEDYLNLYRYLYPYEEEPLLWVHLNTDYPFVVNGILYFPKLKPDVELNQGQIKLFCNQVFVSDNCEEVIPKFLTPLRGVIDSTDIPLNVSRSFLQADRTVRRISDYVAKKVGDRLKEQYRDDIEKYISIWQDLGTFVKFGSLNDDKFKKQVEKYVIFRSTADLAKADEPKVSVEVDTQAEGDDAWSDVSEKKAVDANGNSYTTIQEYLDRNKEKHENRVYYATDEVSQATYISLLKNQGIEVLFMDSFIDTHFVSFLEREYSDVKFSRVDADLDDTLIDGDKSDDIIDGSTNKTRGEQIKSVFEKALNRPQVTIRTEALKGDESAPPAMVLLPEELRRMQEMSAFIQQQSVQFPEAHTLLVNTAHPLIKNVANLDQGIVQADGSPSPSSQLANLICEQVYDLALMAQKGFDADGMKTFTERSTNLLTKLTER